MVSAERSIDDLIELANSDALAALAHVTTRIKGATSDTTLAELLRVQGIANRVAGDLPASRDSFALAIEHAERAGNKRLAALATLSDAFGVAHSGNIAEARTMLEHAGTHLQGLELADLRFQRATILGMTGEFIEARAELTQALSVFRKKHKTRWIAHALFNRAHAAAAMGDLASARRDLNKVRSIFAEADDATGQALVAHNLAEITHFSGDAIAAVVEYRHADRLIQKTPIPPHQAYADHCDALLSVGLFEDAVALGALGAGALAADGNQYDAALQRLVLARALLAAGRLGEARSQAQQAHRSFVDQNQVLRAHRSELVLITLAILDGDVAIATADRASQIGQEFATARTPDWRGESILVEARAHIALKRWDPAARCLSQHRRQFVPFGQDVERASLRALLNSERGRPGEAIRAVRRGLRLVGAVQQTVGAIEIRASLSRHVESMRDVGVLALLHSQRRRAALELLEQATSVVRLGPRPLSAPASLIRHRALGKKIQEAENGFGDVNALRTQREALEREIRRERLLAARDVHPHAAQGDLTENTLRFFSIAGDLWRFDSTERGVSASVVSHAEAFDEALRELMFELRAGLGAQHIDMAAIDLLSSNLDENLGRPGDAPTCGLNIVPCESMDAVPWGLLPSMRGRAWAQTRTCMAGAGGPVRRAGGAVVISGVGLIHGASEAAAVAALYDDSVCLERATTRDALASISGADLVHIAAHSATNADSPMFSAIQLADGDLYVHELEAIGHAPSTVVLASCASATAERVGAGSIGFADALFAANVASVIGTVCEIPDDEDTVAVMVALHSAQLSSDPIAAVKTTANSHGLTDRQTLIARCLVPSVSFPRAA